MELFNACRHIIDCITQYQHTLYTSSRPVLFPLRVYIPLVDLSYPHCTAHELSPMFAVFGGRCKNKNTGTCITTAVAVNIIITKLRLLVVSE